MVEAINYTYKQLSTTSMSSWDRSRSIPWSRAIPVAPATPDGAPEDIDLMKERIWRDLSREAANEQKELERLKESGGSNDANQQQHMNGSEVSNGLSVAADTTQQQPISSTPQQQKQKQPEVNFLGYVGRPYQTSDLLRNLAFGGTIGSITGMCFGFMDSIRSAQSSELLKSASRSAQGKFIFQGTYRSGMFFGGFFGVFHTIKYGIRVLVDPGDLGEISLASVLACGSVFARREWRASLPYAVMLVGMDSFHCFMREDGKA